jgi:hypothetical protein
MKDNVRKNKSRLIQFLESIKSEPNLNKSMFYEPQILGPEQLEGDLVKNMLLTFDEFKGVKKINILKLPSYCGDIKTGKPFENDETSLGGKSKTYQVETVRYNPELTELNEEIDLYSISLTSKIYNPQDLSATSLGIGTWVMPIMYSPIDFTPLREMKIVFSPELFMDMLVDKTAEEVEKEMKYRILKSVEDALDGGLKENVPYELGLIFRLSSRSIKKNA